MSKRLIYILLPMVAFCACQPLPDIFSRDRVVASVGDRVLYASQIADILPSGLDSLDSMTYLNNYAQKWIKGQVKLREAERIFSSSAADIASQVAAYRLSLLNRKLDNYFLSSDNEQPYSDHDIEEYYRAHGGDFRLDRVIVKGRMLRLPKDYDQRTKVEALLKSRSDMSRGDLYSLCQKNGFELEESLDRWIDYSELLDLLPLTRERDHSLFLTRRGVQELSDSEYLYYFEIIEQRRVGDAAPLELVSETIGEILNKRFHIQLIEAREAELMQRALDEDLVKNYIE